MSEPVTDDVPDMAEEATDMLDELPRGAGLLPSDMALVRRTSVSSTKGDERAEGGGLTLS
jgi:hypothetical protein